MADKPGTTRSHEFIRSFQVEAVCEALRFCIASHIELGPTYHQVVKRLRDDFVKAGTGRAIEYIPEVTESMSAPDLYLAAEFLRATILSFHTPEEREERAPFGLRPRPNGGAT